MREREREGERKKGNDWEKEKEKLSNIFSLFNFCRYLAS